MEAVEELKKVYDLLLKNSQELEPEFAKVLVEDFEELLDEE